ncbi:MAG: RluA family pseudouridine synthase [Chloroflexota bacterium]
MNEESTSTASFDPQSMLLHIDSDLIVINKRAGLLSIQDGYDLSLPHLATVFEPKFGKVWIIHRLDKETSGVMLLGRNAQTHRALNEQFKNKTIEKLYHCLVMDNPHWNSKLINLPLLKDADRLHRTRVNDKKGKPAMTAFKVLKRFYRYTLLECQIFTGYTHQIRAHLFHMRMQILGDTLYCSSEQRNIGGDIFGLTRLGLHAYSIALQHPRDGQRMYFTAPYPQDFKALAMP